MKIIKVIYDNNSKFILDIVRNLLIKVYLEEYNISNYKEHKKALPIMTRFGTKQVPLLVFEDENLHEYNAIWNERNPNWLNEINKILNEDI